MHCGVYSFLTKVLINPAKLPFLLTAIMEIVYQSFQDFPLGTVARLLSEAYSGAESSDPEFWMRERIHWNEYDRQVHEFPTTIGASGFVSVLEKAPIGMASWDPRQRPIAKVGHNCVVPSHQGKGYGKAQLERVLFILGDKGFEKVLAETGDCLFFVSAQRMYTSCGFRQVDTGIDHGFPVIKYEIVL